MSEHPRFREALAAMDAGDTASLRRLLETYPALVTARAESDADYYAGYFAHATLLHHVAGNPVRGAMPDNAVVIARILLEAGADVNATCGGGPAQPDTGGGTVLGLIASSGQAENRGHTAGLLDAVLAAGAPLDPAGTGGCMWAALYHTVENRGQRDVAAMLYERGHDVDLCFAAGLGRLDLVDRHLDSAGRPTADADRLYRHHRGRATAAPGDVLADGLLFSCVTGRLGGVTRFLDRGVDVNVTRPWGPFTVTGLHGAAWAGWPDVVELLLRRSADPTIREPTHHATPIGWAAYCERASVLEVFRRDERRFDLLDSLEAGFADRFASLLGDGDPDQAVAGAAPGVFLRAAAAMGHRDVVTGLLSRGADPSLPNEDGKTALDWAVERGHDAIASLLRGAAPRGGD